MGNDLGEVAGKEQNGIFQSIVEAVSQTMNMPACIWVFDEPSQTLQIVASNGLPSSYVQRVFLTLDEPSVTGEAFRSGEVTASRDILHDPRWKYRVEAQEVGWKSVICVPVKVHDAIIGVLSIYTFAMRDFPDEEKRLLTDYAAQIGVALEADRRRRTLRRLLDIGHDFEGLITRDPRVVLQKIAEGACEVTGADCAVIYPYDAAREEFYDKESVVAHGLSKPLHLSERPRTEKGMAAYVKRVGEIVLSDIEKEDPAMLTTSPFIEREGIKAFMGIALKVADRVLGILYVDFRAPHRFNDEERNIVQLFAHQAALAIDNSGLYQQATTRADALKKLHEVGPALVSIPGAPEGLKDILVRIVQNAQIVLGADLVDLYQYVQSQDEYILPPVQVGERYDPTVCKEQVYEDDVVCAIVASRQPQYVAETQSEKTLLQPYTVVRPDAPSARFVAREKIQSTAAIPLIVGTELVGVLFANYRTPQTFPQHQRELIELFASQTAIAIRNARLFKQRGVLQEIGRDITSILDKGELLRRIRARSLELLGGDAGAICLLNKATNQLEFQYGKETYASIPVGKGLIGTAAATRQPVRVGDVTKDPRYIADIPETRSELDVPMLIGEELVGVLNVESTRFDAFDEDSQSLAIILANQAAVALYNAALFDQRDILSDIARDIASELNRNVLIQKIIERSTKLIGCETGAVALVDPSTKGVVFKYGVGRGLETLQVIPHGKGLTGRAVATGKPIRSGNVRQDPAYVEHLSITNSEMIIPLTVGQAVLGILDFQSPRFDAFDQDSEKLAVVLANHAAVAIYNAQLFEQTQQQIQHLSTLFETSDAIGHAAKLEQVLDLILNRAFSFVGKEAGYIILVERRTNTLRIVASRGISAERVAAFHARPTYAHEGTFGLVLQEREILEIPNAKANPRVQDVGLEIPDTLVNIPLEASGRVIGILTLDTAIPDEPARNLLLTLADMAAVAIEKARLFEQSRRLQQLSTVVTSKRDLDEMLQTILAGALDLVDCQTGSIGLLNKKTGELDFKYAVGEQQYSLSLSAGFTGLAVERKKPVRIGDVSKAERYYPSVKGTVSELAVPLMVSDDVVGVLNAESPIPDAFTAGDEEILMALASQAAIAIQNAQKVRTLQVLGEVGQALTAGVRLREEEVVDLIYNQASQLMDTGNMYIALYDQATDSVKFPLAFVDGKRADTETDEFWKPRQAGKGRTEEIIRTKKPILHATKEKVEAWYAQPDHQDYWLGSGIVLPSWLGVPMMVGDRVLGVIATYHSTRDYVYSADDLMILQAMASQAAIALDNARLYYKLNQRLEALVKVGQALTADIRLPESEVVQSIYKQARQLMDTDNMYIALYDHAMDSVRFPLIFENGVPIELLPRRAGKGRTEEIVRTRQPIFHATKAEAKAWYARPEHQEYAGAVSASWLGVPMIVGERVLGVIATYHPTRDYVYSSDDLMILQAMGKLAAIALDNARLYDEAYRLHDEVIATRGLATLGTAMAALQHRINNTFNIIVPNVTRLRQRVDLTDDTIAEILDIIERNARYTSDIISRIQEPLREIESQDVDVNAVLSDVAGKVKEQWQTDPVRRTIDVELDLDDSIPQIQAPIGQIAEVFRNLVDNAYRAMKDGGLLRAASFLADRKICIRVQDTGPGIPLQIQQRLFIKPVPSRDPGGGAGLGLWLSSLMLQSLGGRVIIEKSDSTGTAMLVEISAP